MMKLKVLGSSFILLFGIFTAVNTFAEAPQYEGLTGAVVATMIYNPQIQSQRSKVQASSGLLDSAQAGRLPSISGQVGTDSSSTISNQQGSFSVKQPLWTFGKIDASVSKAEASIVQQQAALLALQRKLMTQVVTAYQNQEQYRKLVQIAQDNVAEHLRLLHRVVKRESVGLASEADVNLAKARLYTAKSTLQGFIGQKAAALDQLKQLTQVDVITDKPVGKDFLEVPAAQELRDLAQKNSADVAEKQAAAEVAKESVESAKVNDMPTLYAQATYRTYDSTSFDNRDSVGLSLEGSTQGLGFVNQGSINSAKAQYDSALHDLDSARNDVRRQMEQLIIAKKSEQALIASQQLNVNALKQTLDSYSRQYNSGRKSWLDVLNTQREYTSLRQSLAQTKNKLNTTLLSMQVLIGNIDATAAEANK